jgi:NitT/TauT family transport system permease protein
MKKFNKLSSFIQGFIILNVVWYALSLLMNSRILPNPLKIYANMPNLIKDDLKIHIFASLYRVGIGLLIAFIIGITIGLIMGYSEKVNKLLNPLIYFSYPIPKMALLPIVMTLFGLGDGSKITMIALITVFQIIVSVRDSVINVSKEDYNMLISLGASKIQLFFHVTLPSIVPDILTNIRLSLGTAFSILFFSEAYGTSKGVGYFIQDAWSRIDYIDLYSGIFILSILGLILFLLLDVIENIVCEWKK